MATLFLPHPPVNGEPQPPIRVDLAITDPITRHALAIRTLRENDPEDDIMLRAVAVALGWPAGLPRPWLADAEAEVTAAAGTVHGLAAWLKSAAADTSEEGARQRKEGARELLQARAALSAAEDRLKAAAVSVASGRAEAARVQASLHVPPIAVYAVGIELLNAVRAEVLGGVAEYNEMVASGFSIPPRA